MVANMIISALLKKGILYEARNTEVEFEIPNEKDQTKVKIKFKAEHMTLKIEKE